MKHAPALRDAKGGRSSADLDLLEGELRPGDEAVLLPQGEVRQVGAHRLQRHIADPDRLPRVLDAGGQAHALAGPGLTPRSEARRVGKECVSTCRSGWSPYH